MERSFALALNYMSNQPGRIYRDFILLVNRLRRAAKNNDKILALYEFLCTLFARLNKQRFVELIREYKSYIYVSSRRPRGASPFSYLTLQDRR